MWNYYIRIEDMPSLVSHQLSIIKYVVLKKIFFFLCFDRLIWTWTRTQTSLDSVLTRTQTSLDLDLSWTRTSLDLDSTKVDLTTALTVTWWSKLCTNESMQSVTLINVSSHVRTCRILKLPDYFQVYIKISNVWCGVQLFHHCLLQNNLQQTASLTFNVYLYVLF